MEIPPGGPNLLALSLPMRNTISAFPGSAEARPKPVSSPQLF